MAKYDSIARRLKASDGKVRMTFPEVEALVGTLPQSARTYRAWWANDRTHVQGLAWLSVGFVVKSVDGLWKITDLELLQEERIPS